MRQQTLPEGHSESTGLLSPSANCCWGNPLCPIEGPPLITPTCKDFTIQSISAGNGCHKMTKRGCRTRQPHIHVGEGPLPCCTHCSYLFASTREGSYCPTWRTFPCSLILLSRREGDIPLHGILPPLAVVGSEQSAVCLAVTASSLANSIHLSSTDTAMPSGHVLPPAVGNNHRGLIKVGEHYKMQAYWFLRG